MKSVYCAVQTGSLNKAVCALYLKGYSKHKTQKNKYTNKQVLYMHQNVTNITFKCILTNILESGFNCAIEKQTNRVYRI